MSENLVHESVATEIESLARLADSRCEDFQHYVLDSKTTFVGPGELFVITYNVPANLALVITAIDIKMLYDISDAAFTGADFRSTFDLNPYGPLAAAANVGQIRFLITGQSQFATAWDIGVINQKCLFVVGGNSQWQLGVNPNQPAGKTLVGVTRANCFIVAKDIGERLKKKETRVLTLPNVP